MKVLLRRNVARVGHIGEIVEVKTGYARNYLLPQGLAVVPTRGNIKAIEAEKQAYLEELAKQKAELMTQANLLTGKEFTITARANEEGHLYGSVGPAQVASAVAKAGIALDVENIVLDEPIRKLDKYDVTVRFAEDVTASIVVWVVPPREGEEDTSAAPTETAGEEDQAEPEDEAPQDS